MKFRVFLAAVALCGGWVAALSHSAIAERIPQVSYDIVPRASWTYDALGWLAARGKMQPFTARDFLSGRAYTRVEIADLIRDLKVVNGRTWEDFTFTERSVLSQLVDEFRSELQILDVDVAKLEEGLDPSLPRVALANAWIYGDVVRTMSDNDTRGSAAFSVFEMRGKGVVFGGALASNTRLLHPENPGGFPVLDHFFFRSRGKQWTWEVGRSYSWVGTAGTGSMWLGDSSPALMLGRANREFSLGRMLGPWKISWEVGGYSEQGIRLYLITKRLEKTFSRKWSLGLIDMTKTTVTPNPLMLLIPAPAYQSLFLSDIDSKWNTVLGFEAMYHPNRRIDTYLQWMVDDMSNPFDPNKTVPKKTGLLIGYRSRADEPMDGAPRLQIEYASIDQFAYNLTRPNAPFLAWTQKGLPLAWPYGGNSQTFSVRTEKKLKGGFDLVTTYLTSKSKVGLGKQQVFSIRPAKDITPGKSVGLILDFHTGDIKHNVFGLQGMLVF